MWEGRREHINLDGSRGGHRLDSRDRHTGQAFCREGAVESGGRRKDRTYPGGGHRAREGARSLHQARAGHEARSGLRRCFAWHATCAGECCGTNASMRSSMSIRTSRRSTDGSLVRAKSMRAVAYRSGCTLIAHGDHDRDAHAGRGHSEIDGRHWHAACVRDDLCDALSRHHVIVAHISARKQSCGDLMLVHCQRR